MLIDPPIVGAIASFGINEVNVIRKPLVSVISTGNELVMPGDKLKEQHLIQIRFISVAITWQILRCTDSFR